MAGNNKIRVTKHRPFGNYDVANESARMAAGASSACQQNYPRHPWFLVD
jgi:hypothetical protein